MSFGFPAYHHQELRCTLKNEEVKRLVKDAAISLFWHLRSETDDQLLFHVPCSGASWGEDFLLSVQGERLLLESRCSWFAQCIDWGKNHQNCIRLLHATGLERRQS